MWERRVNIMSDAKALQQERKQLFEDLYSGKIPKGAH